MPSERYTAFIDKLRDINVANSVAALLEWDQDTYMPPRGAETRAAQLALMTGVAHERLVDDDFRAALEAVEQERDEAPIVATNVREARRVFDRAAKLPTRLVQDIARATTLARADWAKARVDKNFTLFAPHLKKLLDLKREVAEKIGFKTDPYDALMDEFEPGTRSSDVQQVFDELRPELTSLVAELRDAPRRPDTPVLRRHCPRDAQDKFSRTLAAAIGYDFERGRIDPATHPFCLGLSPNDVRITTRYNEHFVPMSIFGTIHETGHALYEQGLPFEHAHTPAGEFISLGIHESQSRLWENMVGRNRAFWEHFFPQLTARFTELANVSLDDWHFAVNSVQPSYIRVEADEVTYNLHIMLRFDLERQMIAGELAVDDVPAAWNAAFEQSLGLTPPNDAQGCLQDVHWSIGIFGYFPTYALGNLYAAQLFTAARHALPELDDQFCRGEFAPLLDWLRINIHRHGKRFRAPELIERVTGTALTHEPFMQYLKNKYGPLYGI